jgi:hypothetical protein
MVFTDRQKRIMVIAKAQKWEFEEVDHGHWQRRSIVAITGGGSSWWSLENNDPVNHCKWILIITGTGGTREMEVHGDHCRKRSMVNLEEDNQVNFWKTEIMVITVVGESWWSLEEGNVNDWCLWKSFMILWGWSWWWRKEEDHGDCLKKCIEVIAGGGWLWYWSREIYGDPLRGSIVVIIVRGWL